MSRFMRRAITACALVAGALALDGCATTPDTQTNYVRACSAYGGALTELASLRNAGTLNASQIAAVSQVDAQITPICTGPLPADTVAATQQVTAAVTTLSVLLAAHEITKAKK